MSRSRIVALVVAACLSAAACGPVAPSTAPTGAPSASVAASAAPQASPGATGVSTAPLADELRDAINGADIVADLGRLQAFSDQNGGARQAGSEGHAASAAFVADELRKAGYEVELQPVDLPYFRQDAPSELEILASGAPAFEDLRDFKAMLFSASGNVTAPVHALGFNPAAQPGERGGLGCDPGDFDGLPSGVIVLVQPAGCRRRDVVVNAQAAGALAIVTAYPDWPRDGVLRPTLIEPADIRIPALGTTQAVGVALAKAAADGASVRLEVHASTETRSSPNVIAETPGGDAEHVVMLGGHLDSVVDGPGVNDNGSGTMTILELARELAAVTGGNPAWKVRVAFWTGEELGLYGSSAYVNGLGSEAERLEAYLNFDMLGSPNGVRLVYDPAGTSRPTEGAALATLFETALDAQGLPWQAASLGGGSDHFPFDQAGIPIGGLFSGANEHKSDTQAALFGGTAGVPDDACYHLACDDVSNIDPVLLEQLARAAAWVLGELASGEVDLGGT